jgi:hypothetical protein
MNALFPPALGTLARTPNTNPDFFRVSRREHFESPHGPKKIIARGVTAILNF